MNLLHSCYPTLVFPYPIPDYVFPVVHALNHGGECLQSLSHLLLSYNHCFEKFPYFLILIPIISWWAMLLFVTHGVWLPVKIMFPVKQSLPMSVKSVRANPSWLHVIAKSSGWKDLSLIPL